MDVDAAHKSRWAIAEVVFGFPLLIAIALQFVSPFSFPQGAVRQLLIAIGLALIVASIGLFALSHREFNHHHQPTDPGQPTSQIITTGVFSISRNPLYLSCAILLFGLALTLNNLWIGIALLISLIACTYVLIAPEEKYLAAKFGEEYREYADTVRRWFGRINRQ